SGGMHGTLMIIEESPKPTRKLFDYGPDHVEERELREPGEIVPYLETDSITWLDVQGLGDEVVNRRKAGWR
ncbi:MAG: magnesium and cobalt transport protein CorA, partial [Nitrospinota bacterium]